jgi:hypothetical protein
MQVCQTCGKALGSAEFCAACDEARFTALGDAITSTYATQRSRKRTPGWLLLSAALVVAGIAGAALTMAFWPRTTDAGAQPPEPAFQPPSQQLAVVPKPATPKPATPKPATPKPATPKPTITPPATPPPSSSPAPAIADAPALVRSTGRVRVGKAGSCGGDDVTISVRGYPRGCTLFGYAMSGRLPSGRATALIVPVSTSEDAGDIAYGLLYTQTSAGSAPHFAGIVRGSMERQAKLIRP